VADGLFGLADDVVEDFTQLLPLMREALEVATREWESLPSGDIDWYASERAVATARWLARLHALVWAMEEFGEELGDV
jgi:hypothetical protein